MNPTILAVTAYMFLRELGKVGLAWFAGALEAVRHGMRVNAYRRELDQVFGTQRKSWAARAFDALRGS